MNIPDPATLSIMMDSLLAALLIAALAYMWRVNRRLGQIRAGKAEFEKMISEFARSTGQASTTLEQLKSSASTAGRELAASTGHAAQLAVSQERMAEDLRMLISRGESLADRIETLITRSRAVAATLDSATPTMAPRVATPVEQAMPQAMPVEQSKPHPVLSAISGLR